jgi:hypothetical protein
LAKAFHSLLVLLVTADCRGAAKASCELDIATSGSSEKRGGIEWEVDLQRAEDSG